MGSTSPKPFAFVLMPLSREFDDVYQLGIKPACEKAGAYAERVDEQIFQESILQRIYNQISKADVVVADMTGRNPNVFYETGYAHALGKPVILLTQAVDDIPFDLKHYAHIVYGGSITGLIPELVKRVSFAIERPREAAERATVEVYIDGKSLRETAERSWSVERPVSFFGYRFDFHNSINTRVKKAKFEVGIVVSSRVSSIYEDIPASGFAAFRPYLQPEGTTILHLFRKTYEILPGAWEAAYISFGAEKDPFVAGESIDMILRVFSEEGPLDFPFAVRFTSQEEESKPEKP